MKPLIGITTDELPNRFDWSPKIYGQNFQYSDAVLAAGGIPVLLPFTHDASQLRDVYDRLDGILFAGGGDIDPTQYGEAAGPVLKDVIVERDRIELQLIKWAIADDKPFLAICRGLQVMNVALGGTLIQDIPTQLPSAQNHDISTEKKDRHFLAHQLRIDPESRLARTMGVTEIKTNTHHHQAIKKPAPGLSVTSWSEDGIIESVELAGSRFAIGVQSHPESLWQQDQGWQKLFAAFVGSAGEDYSLASTRKSSSTDVALEVFEAL